MKTISAVFACTVLCAACAAGGEVGFTAKPTAAKAGDASTGSGQAKVKITFAVSAPTDVAVYIEDAKGEVVRHLVAGVLGQNPPPPLKPGLAQEVEWDGKADYGKPAEGGPFKVRVGLGLGAKYDRVVYTSLPDLGHTPTAAVAPDGTLYVPTGRFIGSRWRLFGRDASYQGVYGVPPGPEAAKFFGWDADDGRPAPTSFQRGGGINSGWIFGNVAGSDAAVVSRDGADLFQLGNAAPPRINRFPLTAAMPKDDKFAVALDGSGAKGLMMGPQGGANTNACLAVSSDGKRLYIGGLSSGENKPLAAVYSVSCPQRTGCQVLFGEPAKTGRDETHLGGAPTGLVSDGKGNLFVADEANGRVVVVDEKDGKYRGEIATEKPRRLGFSTRTGALYVLGAGALKRFKPPVGADPKGWKDLKPEAAVPMSFGPWGFTLAVDETADPTVLWICGSWLKTQRIEDPGTGPKFGASRATSEDKRYPDIKPFTNVQVDRLRKEIYLRDGANGGVNQRFSEKTGKMESIWLNPGQVHNENGLGTQLVPAPNGNLYGLQWPRHFMQWDRDGKGLAWTEPRTATPEDLKCYDAGAGPHPAIAYVPVAMSMLPHNLTARWSDGHLFVIEPYRFSVPTGGRTRKSLHEYLPSGKRITAQDAPILWDLSDAAVGPKFDAAGNIYVAEAVRPKGWIVPAEMAEQFAKKGVAVKPDGKPGEWYTSYKGPVGSATLMYGSILKFGPKGGAVHWDKAHASTDSPGHGNCPYTGELKLDPALKTVDVDYVQSAGYLRGTKVTGAEWIHPGIGHIGFYGCNCENVTFEVDEFGRVFFPDTPQFRVGVIDTNGNAITQFGGYGDNNFAGSESQVVDPKSGRVRARRPDDPRDLPSPFAQPELAFSWLMGVGVTDRYAYMSDSVNLRMLRAKLVYAAEESCAVQ
ncbi:MAG TPA: hypothetical protein PK280_11465 [Planctomycetota bacterium]|nr:hypothetical protein [Planctomycetota bacterium]